MTDAELEALAVKCGIYWVNEKTAYIHADTMRAFAEALFKAERERIAQHFDSRDKGAGGFYDPHEPAEIIRAMRANAVVSDS